MNIDLSTATAKYAIDCTRWRTLKFQCRPASGSADTGVVEIKRAFSVDLSTPSVSLPSTTTLTLDGTAITEIDVTDVAWVHIVCTTLDAGVTVDVEHALSGAMGGSVQMLEVNGDYTGSRGFLSTGGAYKAIVLAAPREAVSTGVFELKRALAPDFGAVAFSPAATLTVDGATVHEYEINDAGVIYANCTTAQTGLRVTLYVYLRAETGAESGKTPSGSVFPTNPSDGDEFYRTDLDMPEMFRYDATRGKWLGELRMWSFSRAQALSSGSMGLQYVSVVLTSTRGLITPSALTIVGIEFANINAGVTCDIDLYEDATNLTTLLSPTTTETAYDHTLNYDIDADAASPKKWVQINNISAGTLSNPIVVLYLRRRES